MNPNIKKLAAFSIAALSWAQMLAISGESGPITGSAVIDGDLDIKSKAESDYVNAWGIKAEAGDSVTSENSPTVTITQQEASNLMGYGLWASGGGKIDLSGSSVVVNGKDYVSTGIFVSDKLSEISVGNGSRIYAGADGSALSVDGGKASVGDNSVLWGNVFGDSAVVIARNGGAISIGNAAAISQNSDGSVENSLHYAVEAVSGASITIGDDAKISVLGEAFTNGAAVNAGYQSNSEASSVRIGDRAVIKTEGTQVYALYGIRKDSEITVGDKAVIETSGASSSGVVSLDGASVSVGKLSEISTYGNSSNGVYSYYAAGSTFAGDTVVRIGGGTSIKTYGDSSAGVAAFTKKASNGEYRADVFLGENTRVETSGTGSYGIAAYYANAKVTAEDGLYVSAGGKNSFAVFATGGGEVGLNDSTILAPDYYAVYAVSDAGSPISKIGINGVQHIEGVVYAGGYGDINVACAAGSFFRGSAGMAQNGSLVFNMKGTEWEMTGSSKFSNISIAEGSAVHMGIYAGDSFVSISAETFAISDSVIKVYLVGYEAGLDDTFQLVVSDNMSVTGSFAFDFSEAKLADGLYWDTRSFAKDGIIRITDVQVPEASAYGAIFALLALAFCVCRKRPVAPVGKWN